MQGFVILSVYIFNRVKRVAIRSFALFLFCFYFKTVGCVNDISVEDIKIPYTSRQLEIDGNLNDWVKFFHCRFFDTIVIPMAPSEFPFTLDYPEGYERMLRPPRSKNTVDVFLCWDMNYLYIAFKITDAHLFAEIDPEDENPDIIFNDGIEIYIDAHGDSEHKMDLNDYQFVVDIQNNTIVFKGDKQQIAQSDKYAVPKYYGQNILFMSAAEVDGFINDTASLSHGYIVEVAVPFFAIGIQPTRGAKMKLDLCNNDVDYFLCETMVVDNIRIHSWPFNWIGFSSFGFPGYWKMVFLEGSPNWFERLSHRARQQWLYWMFFLFATSLIMFAFLYYRLEKTRRIPATKEFDPSNMLVIMGGIEPGKWQSENHRILQKAVHYISQNHSEQVSSEKLAGYLGMSLRKLQRITQQEMNCTPTAFIYVIKLKQASAYLKSGQGNVSETAYEFGFSDPSYFSKLFKKHFGVSPTDYQNKKD